MIWHLGEDGNHSQVASSHSEKTAAWGSEIKQDNCHKNTY